jgi:hypothetical protein
MLVENLSEIGLVMTDDLSWLMFVVACVGLHHAAHPGVVQARSQVEPLVLALQAG